MSVPRASEGSVARLVGGFEVVQADILDWAANYTGPKFHALLCDPPYALTDIARTLQFKIEQARRTRKAAGFMGKSWDVPDVAFHSDTWAALGQHLHPGAFCMAFGGSRTFHRLACAIEDAGFVIHPTIGWAFGSGFPKATRVKGVSAFVGHRYGLQALKPALEFIVVFQKPYDGKPVDCITRTGAGAINVDGSRIRTNDQSRVRGVPSSAGVAFRAHLADCDTLQDRLAVCRDALLHIVFALRSCSIDGRVQERDGVGRGDKSPQAVGYGWTQALLYPNGVWCGRRLTGFPSFLVGCQSCLHSCDGLFRDVPKAAQEGAQQLADVLEHIGHALQEPTHIPCLDSGHFPTESVVSLCAILIDFPYALDACGGIKDAHSGRWPANFVLSEDAAARLDEQSGERTAGAFPGKLSQSRFYGQCRPRLQQARSMADSGGASRYFFRVAEQLDAADPVRYCAKASRAERDAGLEGMPVKMVHRAGHGNNEPDPKTQAFITRCRNVHPTVKPLALTRYLATLLLPPPEYAPRRILVPFAGVASECIGAMQAGWESVVGVEREADYCEIGRKRLDYYAGRRGLFARREAEPVVAQTALC